MESYTFADAFARVSTGEVALVALDLWSILPSCAHIAQEKRRQKDMHAQTGMR